MINWFFSGIYKYRLVVVQLVWQQLTLRYRRAALGFLWTLLNPLLTMVVTSVVFSMIMKWPLKTFVVFLFSGLVPWMFFSNCLSIGNQVLLVNEALIKKVYIPRQVFVVSITAALLIDALFSALSLLLIVIFLGAPLGWSLLVLPVNFIILYVFSLGITLVLSVFAVYFRDLPNVVTVVLQIAYYATPILYPASMVPENYKWIVDLNPLSSFINIFRLPIYEGVLPSLENYGIAVLLALTTFVLGLAIFRKFDRYVVFRM